MKKVLKLSLTLLVVCMMMISSVYAVTSDINMKPSKTTIEEGEEFTVEISTSKLKSDDGVIAFSGTLEYDKQKLTLVKFEGVNGWEGQDDISTGKIAITRSAPTKSDGPILKIIFKANEKSEGNTTISLKDVMLADGRTTPVKVSLVKSDITIKQKAIDIAPENPDNQETPDDSTNKPTTNPDNKTENTDKNNTNSGSNKTDNTTKNEKLPQTGDSNTSLMIVFGLLILAIIVFGIRMININRKLK